MVVGLEPVEPQSLKKLSLKSLKRALDLFSPVHGHYPPPDPESKRVRTNYKMRTEYAAVKNSSSKDGSNSASQDQAQQTPASSGVLALPGPGSHIQEKEGAQNSLIVGGSHSKGLNDTVHPLKSTTLISASASSERNPSTSALMERIPSRWPRPVWRAPWKNYREGLRL